MLKEFSRFKTAAAFTLLSACAPLAVWSLCFLTHMSATEPDPIMRAIAALALCLCIAVPIVIAFLSVM
jgi:hypothetical protein